MNNEELIMNNEKNNVGADLVSAQSKNKYNANQRGITLIAIIITIIILLILAGVTINVLIGENGLFNTAKSAGKKYEQAGAREKLEAILIELQADKLTKPEKYNENEYIDNKLKGNKITVDGEIVTIDGWQFLIDRTVPKIAEKFGEVDKEVGDITSSEVAKNIKLKLDYMGLNIIENINGQKQYTYNNKPIYPLYWYGYKENTMSVVNVTASGRGDIYERTDIQTELTSYLKLTETVNFAAVSWGFNNNNIDYSKYKKMKLRIKDYNINRDGVFDFGLAENGNIAFKQMSICGPNSKYTGTNSEIRVSKGEFELDISNIENSSYDEIYPYIRLYKEGESTASIDIEAVWLE